MQQQQQPMMSNPYVSSPPPNPFIGIQQQFTPQNPFANRGGGGMGMGMMQQQGGANNTGGKLMPTRGIVSQAQGQDPFSNLNSFAKK